ncbi:hypothetical protein ACFXGT_30110 [Streptomyces sp. NPDC059352]
MPEPLQAAATCGAFSGAVMGDWEGLPHRTELSLLSGGDVHR